MTMCICGPIPETAHSANKTHASAARGSAAGAVPLNEEDPQGAKG